MKLFVCEVILVIFVSVLRLLAIVLTRSRASLAPAGVWLSTKLHDL
jgi:hypothetical protein